MSYWTQKFLGSVCKESPEDETRSNILRLNTTSITTSYRVGSLILYECTNGTYMKTSQVNVPTTHTWNLHRWMYQWYIRTWKLHRWMCQWEVNEIIIGECTNDTYMKTSQMNVPTARTSKLHRWFTENHRCILIAFLLIGYVERSKKKPVYTM